MILLSCQKEYSVENSTLNNVATGTLLDSLGNCKEIKINGVYNTNFGLNAANYIIVNANFTAVGNYTISSDTLNGFWFIASGYAFTPGLKTLTINGFGKPTAPIDTRFSLRFSNSICFFTVPNSLLPVTPPTNNDYFPTTTNSNWTYFNSSINDTVIINVNQFDKQISGNAYRQFNLHIPKSNSFDTLFYRKDGAGNYYRYYNIGNGPKEDFVFLKDYAAVGAIWESPIVSGTISGNPADIKYKFTIIDKDISSMIGTNTIDSIISVKEETQFFISGTFSTKNTFIYNYAKKIGLVEIRQENAVPNLLIPVKRWLVY